MRGKFNFKVGDVLRSKGFLNKNNNKLVRIKRVMTIHDEICINDHHIPHYMDLEPIDDFIYENGDKWEDGNFNGWLCANTKYWTLYPDYDVGRVITEVLNES